jgi:hypothetical protein
LKRNTWASFAWENPQANYAVVKIGQTRAIYDAVLATRSLDFTVCLPRRNC